MERPTWLAKSLYPFESHTFETDDGAMHYVDEGTGHPVLMVHGTPTWSFLFRNLITHLTNDHRVIAVDHLGFGLSEKPVDAPYRPADHANRLTQFIDSLGIDEFTLVVHDFGGPIGLSYAIDHPGRVRRIVLFNTWLWSLADDTTIRLANLLTRGAIGRLFYRQLNGSPKLLLKTAWGSENELTPDVHRHYTRPFASVDERTAPLVLARELIGSTEWYDSLWQQRSEITDLPTLLVWGLADPAFDRTYLERWESILSTPTVHRLPHVGHFVPDEAADRANPIVTHFLATT